MKTYIISYDLRKVRDYKDLHDAIKSYGTWAHVLKSLWVVHSNSSAKEIREKLLYYMDSDDGIFVVKSGGEAAWRNVISNNEWLKKYL